MSDLIDGDEGGDDAGATRHGAARSLAEAALRARADGRIDESENLLDQATRIDPGSVETLLSERAPGDFDPGAPIDPVSSDREVELISRTLEAHADAPSRAGITGAGSGADSQ